MLESECEDHEVAAKKNQRSMIALALILALLFVHEHTQISNEFLEDLELIEELRQFIEPKDLPESQDTVKQVREN